MSSLTFQLILQVSLYVRLRAYRPILLSCVQPTSQSSQLPSLPDEIGCIQCIQVWSWYWWISHRELALKIQQSIDTQKAKSRKVGRIHSLNDAQNVLRPDCRNRLEPILTTGKALTAQPDYTQFHSLFSPLVHTGIGTVWTPCIGACTGSTAGTAGNCCGCIGICINTIGTFRFGNGHVTGTEAWRNHGNNFRAQDPYYHSHHDFNLNVQAKIKDKKAKSAPNICLNDRDTVHMKLWKVSLQEPVKSPNRFM